MPHAMELSTSTRIEQSRSCWFPEYEPIGLRPIGWGDLERIPKELWVHHGDTEDPFQDDGIPSRREGAVAFRHDFGLVVPFVPLEEFCEKECFGGDERHKHVDGDGDEDIRIRNRSQRNVQLEAGMRLMNMLFLPETAEMCIIVGLYIRLRMDGVIRHFFKNLANAAVVEATLYLVEKIREHQPEISSEAREFVMTRAEEEIRKMKLAISDALKKYRDVISPEAMAAAYRKQQAMTKPPGPVTKLAKVLWG